MRHPPLTPELLKDSAREMIVRDPLPGSDEISARLITEKELEPWVLGALDRVETRNYEPQPYLRFWLRTHNKQRPIDCPSLIDRVLMHATMTLLGPKLTPAPSSYGGAGRGWQQAVKSIEMVCLQAGREHKTLYALKYDIKNFFPSVGHLCLFELLKERLDPSLIEVVRSWLNTPSIEGSRMIPTSSGLGLPQGLPISPMLSELYLEDFDQWLCERGDGVTHYRYVDDCLSISSDRQTLLILENELTQWLKERRGLHLSEAKCALVDLSLEGVEYLGHHFNTSLTRPLERSPEPVSIKGSTRTSLSTALAREALRQLNADGLNALQHLTDVRSFYTIELERAGKTNHWYQNAHLKRPLRTLYLIDTPARVAINRGALKITPMGGVTRELPLSHIGQIIAIGPVELTSAATRYLLSEDIPMLFLSSGGRYYGRLDSALRQREPMLERQFALKADSDRRLALAKRIVIGRFNNARILLSRNNRKKRRQHKGVDDVIHLLKMLRKDVRRARDLAELRGVEGMGTRAYWSAFKHLLPKRAHRRAEPSSEEDWSSKNWSFTGRNRRPPQDPINSLISLISVLLMYNLYSIIELCGLTPYVGIYHSTARRAPALAFDMIEEFRAPLVEGVVLGLVGRKVIAQDDFEWRDTPLGRGVFLKRSALPRVIHGFEHAMLVERTHPQFHLRGSYRRMAHLQVLHMAACMESGDEYQPLSLK